MRLILFSLFAVGYTASDDGFVVKGSPQPNWTSKTKGILDMGTGKIAFLTFDYAENGRGQYELKAPQSPVDTKYENIAKILELDDTNKSEKFVSEFQETVGKTLVQWLTDDCKLQKGDHVIVGCTGSIRTYAMDSEAKLKAVLDTVKEIGAIVEMNFDPMVISGKGEVELEKRSTQYLCNNFSRAVENKRYQFAKTKKAKLEMLGHFASGGQSQQYSGPDGGKSIDTGRNHHFEQALGDTFKKDSYHTHLLSNGIKESELERLKKFVRDAMGKNPAGEWNQPGIYNIISGFCQTWFFRGQKRGAKGSEKLFSVLTKSEFEGANKLVTKKNITDAIQAFKDSKDEFQTENNDGDKIYKVTIQRKGELEDLVRDGNKKKSDSAISESFGTLLCLSTLEVFLELIGDNADIFFTFHRNFPYGNKAGWPCGYFIESGGVHNNRDWPSYFWLAIGAVAGLVVGVLIGCCIGGSDDIGEEFIEGEDVGSDGSGSDAGSDNNDKNGKADNNNKGDSPKDKAGDAVEDGADRV